MQHAIGAEAADVAGMHPAAFPELLGGFRILEITLRGPGRAEHDLAGRFTVMRQQVHLLIDNLHIAHQCRTAGPRAQLGLVIEIAAEFGAVQLMVTWIGPVSDMP